jgi:hypothetical protein
VTHMTDGGHSKALLTLFLSATDLAQASIGSPKWSVISAMTSQSPGVATFPAQGLSSPQHELQIDFSTLGLGTPDTVLKYRIRVADSFSTNTYTHICTMVPAETTVQKM